jgi:hypothetical protein
MSDKLRFVAHIRQAKLVRDQRESVFDRGTEAVRVFLSLPLNKGADNEPRNVRMEKSETTRKIEPRLTSCDFHAPSWISWFVRFLQLHLMAERNRTGTGNGGRLDTYLLPPYTLTLAPGVKILPERSLASNHIQYQFLTEI